MSTRADRDSRLLSGSVPVPDETTELSAAEEQLWRAEHAGPTALPFFECARTLSIVVRIENTLKRSALRASLREIVRRHDVLRSRFVATTGRPERVVRRASPVRLRTVDLRQMRAEQQAAGVEQVLARHVKRHFDLARGPLLRTRLLALDHDHHILAVTVHHIVFDRWSRRLLAIELKQLYETHASGRAPDLQPLRARYADYVQRQRELMAGDVGRRLVEQWTARLAGLSDLVLPCDGARDRVLSTRSGTCGFTIPAEDAGRLRLLSRRCKVTLATVVLAILKLFLNRVGGSDDIAVGVPLSDRRQPQFEPLIGLFMNVVVVRTTVTGDLTFLDLVDRVRRALVDACRYQDLPYGCLLQAIGAQRPLYRVVFNFMPEISKSQLELPGLRVTPLEIVPARQSVADLSFHVRPNAGALRCRLVYRADLFSPARVRSFAAQLQTLVSAVLDDPHKCVSVHDLSSRAT